MLVAAAAAALAVLHALLVVPRLPAPDRADLLPGEQSPPPWRDLVTTRNVGWLLAGPFVVGQVAWLTPPAQWPVWVVYAGAGASLVWVDALTTWLPRRLNYLVLAQLLIALVVTAAISEWGVLFWSAVGGAACAGMLWLVWRLSPTFGFGDVRLGVMVGMVGGLAGPFGWLTALLFGTIIGAVVGVVAALIARRRDVVFPYGPALWLGPPVAVAISALTG